MKQPRSPGRRGRLAAGAARAEPLESRMLLSVGLVRDINLSGSGSDPASFARAGDTVFFSAQTLPTGRELFKTDGTAAGTTLVKDLAPGPGPSDPRDFVPLADTTLFVAKYYDDRFNGSEAMLWRTDGTAAGTVPVIQSLDSFFKVTDLTRAGDRAFFHAWSGSTGEALWTTDGTADGTVVVRDQVRDSLEAVVPGSLRAVGDKVTFLTTGTGTRLWASDGTHDGTVLLQNFIEFASDPVANLTSAGGLLFFSLNRFETGAEPWVSDGTPEGTRLLKDVRPGGGGSAPAYFVATGTAAGAGGPVVYFAADDGVHGIELWKSDGTPDGTSLVKDVRTSPVPGGTEGSLARPIGMAGDAMLFVTPYAALPLWKTDGTEAGTTYLTDLGAGEVLSSAESGGKRYIIAGTDGALVPRKLWVSDGTQPGTSLVSTFDTGQPAGLADLGAGRVIFSNADVLHGREPWVSDGTPAGTFILADLETTTASSAPFGFFDEKPVRPLDLGNGRLLFPATWSPAPARYSHGDVLYSTDGTTEGTILLDSYSSIDGLTTLGGMAYVLAERSNTRYLIRTDGTRAGTRIVTNVNYATGLGGVDSFVVYRGALYFAADRPGAPTWGMELWRSDGTSAGTRIVKDIVPGTASSNPRHLAVVGDTLYVTVNPSTSGFPNRNELWKTDGTAAGTVLVKKFTGAAGESTDARDLADVNGTLFFRARSANGRQEQLWKSDGTAAGTVMLKQFRNNRYSVGPFDDPIVTFNGKALFEANEGPNSSDDNLWVSDGTAAGTVPLMVPGNGGVAPVAFLSFFNETGGRLYFRGQGPGGFGIWTTDGTPAGTRPVVVDRAGFSVGPPLAAADGRVYFNGYDASYGSELWQTDGTAEGTARVTDVAPGSASSVPWGATVLRAAPGSGAQDRLIFWADDGVHGREPWALTLPSALVVGRRAFYNNSAFDGRNAAANAAHDGAVATDKRALRPGDAATFANVTSYTKGINGVMIDVASLPAGDDAAAAVAGALEFRAGRSGEPATWPAAPAPSSVTVRRGAGANGSDRITITWPDGAIRNTWLRVALAAGPATGLESPDVFYLGNLAGDTGLGNGDLPAATNAIDLAAAMRQTVRFNVPVTNPYDFDRDGRVTALDWRAARANPVRTLAPFTAPVGPDPVVLPPPAPGSRREVATELLRE